MKKLVCLFCVIFISISLVSCSKEDSNKVVVYSCLEDFREEYLLGRLNEEFPNYDIVIEYNPTGKTAAKLKAEGTNTACDIVLSFDIAYAQALKDNFADLSSYDYSNYLDDSIPKDKRFLTWERYSGCVVINPALLEEKGLAVPTSYQDLLNPEYKSLITMPDPKSSATGFLFLQSLVNAMGEDAAFDYFDALSKNILQFTSSGSGPINSLIQGESAIGLGMTFQAVREINNGSKFDILFFDEGAPYSIAMISMIDGKQDRKAAKDVFDFFINTLLLEDKELFSPEKIFKTQEIAVENYPKDIHYADMTGLEDQELKQSLIERWKY